MDVNPSSSRGVGRTLWFGFIAVLIPLAGLVPLLDGRLPRGADSLPHWLRVIVLEASVRSGDLWPRFSPYLAYGYGYPLFNFYAPLTYYLALLARFCGLEAVPALHLVLALSVGLGAVGVGVLAREWFGEGGGYIAASVYAFAPYILFNVYARTTPPELFALGLLPWLLWSARRALLQPTPLALLRLAVVYAALALAHNLTLLIGTVLLLMWVVAQAVSAYFRNTQYVIRNTSLTAVALLCGLLLTAFFWLPAFLETSAVQVSQLSTPATLDFRNYFLSLVDLIRTPFVFDPQLQGDQIPVAFGLPQAVLAVLGFGVAVRRPETRVAAWLCAGGLLITLAMTLTVTHWLWAHVPLLPLVQFPWRFLGPATVFAAVLAGGLATQPAQNAIRTKPLWPIVILLLCALNGWAWTYNSRYTLDPHPTLQTVLAYETQSRTVGLTSTNEFLPVGVKQLPAPDALSPFPERLQPVEGVLAQTLDIQPLALTVKFESALAFTATFRWFYFPGWQAKLDGAPTTITPSNPYGFITVSIPAGAHTLQVWFGSTPLRLVAGGLSVFGLVGLAALWWLRPKLPTAEVAESENGHRVHPLGLALVAVGLIGIRLSFDTSNPFYQARFDGQTVQGAQLLDVLFGSALNLIAFDPPAATLPADQPLAFTLYWRPVETTTTDYAVTVQLMDAEGNRVGQADDLFPGGWATSRWAVDGYAHDAVTLTPYPGTPPGLYRVLVGLYPFGGDAVDVLDANRLPSGRLFELATVTLTAPTHAPTEAELTPQNRINAPLGPLTLIGADVTTGTVASGEALPVVLYWRVTAPTVPLRARLELVAESGEAYRVGEVAVTSAETIVGAGLRQAHLLTIPPTAPRGAFRLQVTVLDEAQTAVAAPVTLTTLNLNPPERAFTRPPMAHPLNSALGEGLTLLGYNLSAATITPGGTLDLTLYWQALKQLDTRYTVFVQMLTRDGQLLSQIDRVPVNATRPTTGWLPPEVLTDSYSLTIPTTAPPAEYQLVVGLYDPRTGLRLTTSTGADHISLQTIVVR